MKKSIILKIMAGTALVAMGLGIYACKMQVTLSGQSIPANARTVSVRPFINQAPLANPILAQQFSENLKNKFQRETKLELVGSNADLEFEGSISGYSVMPMAIQGNQTASTNRLTVSIMVSYTNTLQEEKNFNQSFSRFADFPANQTLSAVEGTLLPEIQDQLAQDVFNRAFIDW